MGEVREVRARPPPRVQLRHPQRRRGHRGVAEGLQRGVADVDGVLDRLLPVRVLVADGREDLVAVVAVHVAHVRAEDAIPNRKSRRKFKILRKHLPIVTCIFLTYLCSSSNPCRMSSSLKNW